ncbi:MAG: beta-ketoacyl synthase chain length factor [Moraxellaceae bacterium]|nr:beta-ketoacyl synthase chain length factor [Moraxellaceae bacterium]
MSANSATTFRFSLARWSAWAPRLPDATAWLAWAQDGRSDDSEHTPAVAAMAPMLRRRLGRYGRMALETLFGLGDNTGQPIVFASRHGELSRCLSLLEERQSTGGLSPQGFSVAVHNAVPGLYTIDRQVAAPVSAVAAGADSFAAALIEAAALLADGHEEVWLAVCEEPVPEIFAAFIDEPQQAFAFALALRAGDEWGFSVSQAASPNAAATGLPGALQCLRGLLRGENTLVSTPAHCWQLTARNAERQAA